MKKFDFKKKKQKFCTFWPKNFNLNVNEYGTLS